MSWTKVWNVQKAKGERNRLSIIEELSKENLTFKQLESKINIHKTNLAKHLKELRKADEVFKVYDKKLERDVYSATNETIIKRLILPELLGYCGANTLKGILLSKEPIIEVLGTNYYKNKVLKAFIEDKYPHRKIKPEEIIEVMEKIPEIAHHIKHLEKLEKAWLEGIKYKVQFIHPIYGKFIQTLYVTTDESLEKEKKRAEEHGIKLEIIEL